MQPATWRESLHRIVKPLNERAFAVFYWRVAVVVGLVATAGIFLWGLMRFEQALGVFNAPEPDVAPAGAALDRTAFERAVAGYEARQEAYQALEVAPPSASDPSK